MKKPFLLLLCAALLLLPFAIAEEASDGVLTMVYEGTEFTLNYDNDPSYSKVEDGLVQSSFYIIEDDGSMLELFLIFSEDVAAGDTYSTEVAAESQQVSPGIFLYITTDTDLFFGYASQSDGAADPVGSHYEISFAEVTHDGTNATYAGSYTATLAPENTVGTTVDISGEFYFTIDTDAVSTAETPSEDGIPSENETPSESPDIGKNVPDFEVQPYSDSSKTYSI